MEEFPDAAWRNEGVGHAIEDQPIWAADLDVEVGNNICWAQAGARLAVIARSSDGAADHVLVAGWLPSKRIL